MICKKCVPRIILLLWGAEDDDEDEDEEVDEEDDDSNRLTCSVVIAVVVPSLLTIFECTAVISWLVACLGPLILVTAAAVVVVVVVVWAIIGYRVETTLNRLLPTGLAINVAAGVNSFDLQFTDCIASVSKHIFACFTLNGIFSSRQISSDLFQSCSFWCCCCCCGRVVVVDVIGDGWRLYELSEAFFFNL